MAGHRLGVLLWMCVCVLDGVAENIALNKTTSASGVYWASSNAVDGDTNSFYNQGGCFHSAIGNNSITSAWWRVDLVQKNLVHDVIIYFRTDIRVRRNGIQIYIADTTASPTDGVNCYTVTGNRDGTDIPDVLNATCFGEGRYIVLYTIVTAGGDSIPILDFCEVEVNVCGPGTFGADCDNYCHCDGDVCNYGSGVCPSGVCLPGWHQETCHTACGHGTFGTNFNNFCHCDGETCDHVTGVCPSGVCLPGWQTETCDTECDAGSYGTNCTETCSKRNCKNVNTSCDHVTGKCVDGCKSGWYGADCTQVCESSSFGTNCTQSCSQRNCKDQISACNHVTGMCVGGLCDFGSFGSDCSETCSSRNCKGDNSSCDHVTGECAAGCIAGWDGTDCKQESKTHDPPLIHSISLVIGVVVGVVLTLLLAGGVQVYLLRTGRLTWMPGSVKEGDRQDIADTNMSQSPDSYTSMSELSHTGRRDMDDNDYAGLDTDTRADNKLYDVIQN